MTNTNEQLGEQFRKVFEAKWDRSELAEYDDLREKSAFHMTDIARNLTALADTYSNAGDCDTACLAERLELFFNDCVPHLMAAANIYEDIPQVFEEQNGVHDWDSFKENEVAN